MQLTDQFEYEGKKYDVVYHDISTLDELPEKIDQHYGVCFVKADNEYKILLVKNEKKQTWGLVGGKTEPGEAVGQTLERELQEEANVRLLTWHPIGYQVVSSQEDALVAQLRSACIVKPIGPFVADPDGSVTEIGLFEVADVPALLGWGKIGERIIQRSWQRMFEEV